MALSRDPRVADATRERVAAVAARLGYVYDRGAAGLRKQKTGLVGFAVNDLNHAYHAGVAAGIESRLATLGQVLVLGNADESAERQLNFLAALREHRVDGILITPARGVTAEMLARVVAWGIPLVQVSREVAGANVDFVAAAHREAFVGLARHLIALGHRRIALVGGEPSTSTAAERAAGYREALQAAGIAIDPRLHVPGRVSRDGGYQAVEPLLHLADRPTAVMAFNDEVAFGVMLGLRSRGVEPGVDCAVTGVEDTPEAELWRPQLATAAIDAARIGATAADLLLARIRDPALAPGRVLVDSPLRLRASACPPPSGVRPGAGG
jgi:LacI family transcriptional regulator